VVAALVCAVVVSPLAAADLGDPAAPLKIKDWIKGEPVDLAKGKDKNVFVVEFWATWCGPCVASIPHLTDLQKKYKDKGVIFVGVSDEPTGKVEPFVESKGDSMGYVVACDPSRDTHKAYMEAYEQPGIPTSFVIDKNGRIVWIGHPMNGLEETLENVLNGKYDLDAAKKAFKEEREFQRKHKQIREKMGEYFKLAEAEGDKNNAKMTELADAIMKDAGKNANAMNEFAWIILTAEPIKNRDLKLAMRAAQAAYDACEGKNWMIIDTYARALFDTGKIADAVKHQQKALELCDMPQAKKEVEDALKRYKESLPPDA
jgi:thiol-disulfide isomerase/thioredoxin